MSYEDADVPLKDKRINFQKFYDMFSIAAELEALRLCSYEGVLKSDRATNVLLVNHMRAYAPLGDSSLGIGALYGPGVNPSGNESMNSAEGSKFIKKIVTIMSTSPTKSEPTPEP